jgi:hypothetical protein
MDKHDDDKHKDKAAPPTPAERFAILQAAATIYTGLRTGNAAESPADAVAAATAMLALIPS